MTYISAANEFTDPKSSCRNTVDENGKHHINGTYFLNGVGFRFSLMDLRYAQKFWDFCRAQGVYREENPLEKHMQETADSKSKKSRDDAMHKAAVFSCLPAVCSGRM